MVKRGKYRVRRAFRAVGGTYITNDNVHMLSEAEIEERVARGYVEHNGGIEQAPPHHRPLYLGGIDFASDAAAELAAEFGLTADSFAGLEPSGTTGYTVADVRGLKPQE
jgi:hypothetical protein